MFNSVGKYALKLCIKTYGPRKIYTDLYRISLNNISEIEKRKDINETVKFFLRNENIELDQIIQNKNIHNLMIHAHNDIEKSNILSQIKKYLK